MCVRVCAGLCVTFFLIIPQKLRIKMKTIYNDNLNYVDINFISGQPMSRNLDILKYGGADHIKCTHRHTIDEIN